MKTLPKVARNEALQEMRNMGLSVRQIERLTGVGHGTISRVTQK